VGAPVWPQALVVLRLAAPDALAPEEKEMVGYFEALRQAGLEPFPQLRDDPEWQEVAYPIGPGAMLDMAWDGHDDGGIGPAWYRRFDLKRPRFVYAIRFRCSYRKTADNEAAFRVVWRNSAHEQFDEAERGEKLSVERDGEIKTVTVWVNRKIDQFRIHPDSSSRAFRLAGIELLVPKLRP
jgi:hypothetical protein